METVYTLVSFMAVPLVDIGVKANEILALGWRYEETLPDRWTVRFAKDVPETTPSASADAELRALMGDLWIDP